ncbi:MAG TPA: universal stress protein [Kiloniellales bacterium]|nr:universal stress protein [Kiloniellales bacterium]
MTLASILVVLSGGPESEAALRTALTFGRAFEAHVRLLHVEIDAVASAPLLGEGMPAALMSDLTASLLAERERSRKAVQQLFEVHCREHDLIVVQKEEPPPARQLSVSLVIETGNESERIAEEGRLHDLIVVARTPAEAGFSGPTLEAALFESGRPVLLAPRQALDRLPQRIAFAWNGSREAARAAALTLPLLSRAQEVVVISGEGKDDRPVAHPNALKRYLAVHGIAADAWKYQPEDSPVAGSLVEQAKIAGANLLVMGAYGHSRLRELVLGGATRAALKASDLAVLMVH